MSQSWKIVRRFSYVALFAVGVMWLVDRNKTRFVSPSGRSTVQITESCWIADCEISVTLKSPIGTRLIAQKSDCVLNFAQAGWSSDESEVGVYIDGWTCGDIRAGYSTMKDDNIPFEAVSSYVSKSLVRDYQLTAVHLDPYHGDPLLWAAKAGRAAFEIRFNGW